MRSCLHITSPLLLFPDGGVSLAEFICSAKELQRNTSQGPSSLKYSLSSVRVGGSPAYLIIRVVKVDEQTGVVSNDAVHRVTTSSGSGHATREPRSMAATGITVTRSGPPGREYIRVKSPGRVRPVATEYVAATRRVSPLSSARTVSPPPRAPQFVRTVSPQRVRSVATERGRHVSPPRRSATPQRLVSPGSTALLGSSYNHAYPVQGGYTGDPSVPYVGYPAYKPASSRSSTPMCVYEGVQ